MQSVFASCQRYGFRYCQMHGQHQSPPPDLVSQLIIFLISCFIALKRDTTLSIRFCDLALFSYMESNHPVHVHIVHVSWAFSQSLPKPIELLASAGVIHFTFSRASVLKVILISAVNNERGNQDQLRSPLTRLSFSIALTQLM